MLCPCGSNFAFSTCCHPFISYIKTPHSAELLMRSRFSAYATKNGRYIYQTYGIKQQSAHSLTDIQSWADECTWLALIIEHSDKSTVEFSAYYLNEDILFELREVSKFRFENSQWRYISGDITQHNKIAVIKRNELCPCNRYQTSWSNKNDKKYKHCCAK
jgi:SEC-C motif-containing protein